MPAPLAPAKRERILADLRDGMPRNEAARKHHVSPSTVSSIARTAEPPIAFDRTATKSATEARQADTRDLRSQTSLRFLRVANDLLDRLGQPHVAFSFGGKDNAYNEHEFDRPPSEAVKAIVTAAAIAFDKHLAQDKHDSDDSAEADAAKSLLASVLADMTARHGDGA